MKRAVFMMSVLLLLGCSQEKKSQQAETSAAPEKIQAVESAPVAKAAPVTEKKVGQKQDVVEKKVAPKQAEVAKVVAKKPVEEVKEVKTEVVPKAEAIVKENTINGAAVFKKCAGCHGENAQKQALGKSHIIKGWDKDKIITAVHGYKDGTYGGAMKAVMKGQVSGLSDAEINAVAEYISKL